MKKALLLGFLGLATLLPSTVQAMEFQVFFDQGISKAPDPYPPFVGRGYFSFLGENGEETLGNGSYQFSKLQNIALSFAFVGIAPSNYDPIYVYNFYNYPYPDSNADALYDPSQLKVVIYDNASKFYFDGPSSTVYGNLGSLTLRLKKDYLDDYFPGVLQPESYLSFQPNNPSGGSPTPPYNNYGAYVTCAPGNAACGTTDPSQAYNGTYGTVVPAPLPLMAAAATFGWSRKLRRRLSRGPQQPSRVV